MDSGHTSGLTSRIKGKQRIKECFYVEPACSKIDMQRIANDHMSYMSRVRAKFEMDGEIPGIGLPGHRDFTNSYMNTQTWGITRDGQGCHHLLRTPQPWSTVIFEVSRAPEHYAHVQGNNPCPPRDSNPTD
jgi:hypothetical protein